MGKIFTVYLAPMDRPNSEACADLELPAGPYALLDALDKLRLQQGEKIYMEISEYNDYKFLEPLLDWNCSVYALNALAQRLSELNDNENAVFNGLLKAERDKRNGLIPVNRLLDLAYSTDCCHLISEVTNDAQLGRFYAKNGFVPEIDDLSDEVFELLDFEKIGRQIRTNEGGVLTDCGYVVQHSDLKMAPFRVTVPPQKPDYVFQLILDNYPFDEDNHEWLHIPLDLPATEEEMLAALGKLDAPSWDEVIITGFDGAIPNLKDLTDDVFLEIEQLNEFAAAVRKVEQAGQLPKYKAVLEATECTDLDIAVTLADRLDEYIFDPNISGFTGLAEDELRFSVSEQMAELLKKHLNLYQYGQDVLKKDNAALTKYGFIQRENGQPIQSMEQPSDNGMEMV